ncbi:ROK family protein, partial [Pseudonocardia sp. KRD291]|uniref:ROK family protein n=1 Tax=Pseudonocardia sp. KRD291 TaxID=2792007 RepID=UPI001C4A5BC4
PCGCGGTGCVEQYAGLPALLSDAAATDLPALRAAARRGDASVTAALERAGATLGVALSSVINVVDLTTVVLGGTYAELADSMVPAVREEIVRRCPTVAPDLRVTASAHGPLATAIGAARAALGQVVDDPDRLLGTRTAEDPSIA